MALKDKWKDLQNAIEGVPNSGDDISADTINAIARAVIDIENDGVGTSGNYNDLTNKPITVLNYYPSKEDLEKMGEGIYLAKVEDKTIPDYMYFFSTYENWEYECPVCGNRVVAFAGAICPECFTEMSYEDEFKHRSWTVTIISNNGIRVERKDEYRNFRNGRENYTIDWREVPLNDNTATKDYVDRAIGDIETSLENIIAKYGLGGDSV